MSASTAPEAPTRDADSLRSKSSQFLKNCWSCRVLSGGGLVLSGAYVFSAARRVMQRGGPTTVGAVAQITFAASELYNCSTFHIACHTWHNDIHISSIILQVWLHGESFWSWIRLNQRKRPWNAFRNVSTARMNSLKCEAHIRCDSCVFLSNSNSWSIIQRWPLPQPFMKTASGTVIFWYIYEVWQIQYCKY